MNRTTGLLLCCVGTLAALGTVMVFSVTSARAATMEAGVQYLLRHLLWVGVGVAGLVGMSRVDYRRLERWHALIGLAGFLLLALVLVPGIGVERNGARRWIRFGPLGFQPSEFAKLSMLVILCGMAGRRGKERRSLRRTVEFLPCMGVVALTAGAVLVEPDFGTAALVGLLGMLVVLAAGAPLAPLAGFGLAGAAGMGLLLWSSPGRLARILAFLDPWKYRRGAGYQLIHSLLALGSGGVAGRGPGASHQKLFFLPEADTDFILAAVGEEFGLLGTLLVVVLFSLILRQGLIISRRAPDRFGSLLALGVTLMVVLPALVHIAVVTGSVPTKGLPLPFVSAGGSALLACMMGVGVLLNISGRCGEAEAGPEGWWSWRVRPGLR